jgi:hypothetical protein
MTTRVSQFQHELSVVTAPQVADRIINLLVSLGLIGLAVWQIGYTLHNHVSWQARLTRSSEGAVRLDWELRRAYGYWLEDSGSMDGLARVDTGTPANPVAAQDFRELLFFDASGREQAADLDYRLLDSSGQAKDRIAAFLADPHQQEAEVRISTPDDLRDNLWLFGSLALVGVFVYIYGTRRWRLLASRRTVKKINEGLFWRWGSERPAEQLAEVRAMEFRNPKKSGSKPGYRLELKFQNGETVRFPLVVDGMSAALEIAEKVRAVTRS